MTIRRLIETLRRERQDDVIDEERVREYVNALETTLCTEVFMTHEAPPLGVFLFMGWPIPPDCRKESRWTPHEGCEDRWPPFVPHAPGYSEEWSFEDWKDIPLLALPPYDGIYIAYIRWQTDLANNDTVDASNSQRLYYNVYNDFARYWNRTHMPVQTIKYHGYYPQEGKNYGNENNSERRASPLDLHG